MSDQPLVWILNLDAEDELRSLGPYCRSKSTEQIIAQQTVALRRALLGPGDFVAGESVPKGTRAIAWSPTPLARLTAEENGWKLPEHASVDVIRRVNDKSFLIEACTDLESADSDLPRSIFREWSPLQAELSSQPDREWWVRSTLACAGRHRLRVTWNRIDERQKNWLTKTCAHTGVTVQPFVTVVKEVSTSGWIERDGRALIADPRVQVTGDLGVWAKSLGRYAGELENSPNFHRAAHALAQRLFDAGYFGPFGLDSFAFKMGDEAVRWHVYGDLNARFTMDWGDSFRIENQREAVAATLR